MTNTIKIMPGGEGIKEAYRLSLQTKSLDIVCLTENYEEVIGDFFDKEYAPKLYDGTRETREILPDSPDNRAYALKKGELNQTRFITGQAESDMLLFDNVAILISYDHVSPYACVIEDNVLVKGMKKQFEALWTKLK